MSITRKQIQKLPLKISNHTKSTKKGIIKGYSDRAKKLCNPEYLNGEIKNIQEVLKENGYREEEIKEVQNSTIN